MPRFSVTPAPLTTTTIICDLLHKVLKLNQQLIIRVTYSTCSDSFWPCKVQHIIPYLSHCDIATNCSGQKKWKDHTFINVVWNGSQSQSSEALGLNSHQEWSLNRDNQSLRCLSWRLYIQIFFYSAVFICGDLTFITSLWLWDRCIGKMWSLKWSYIMIHSRSTVKNNVYFNKSPPVMCFVCFFLVHWLCFSCVPLCSPCPGWGGGGREWWWSRAAGLPLSSDPRCWLERSFGPLSCWISLTAGEWPPYWLLASCAGTHMSHSTWLQWDFSLFFTEWQLLS